MSSSSSNVRSPSLLRRLGKYGLFLSKFHSPSLAWWLAAKDATKHQNYRGIARDALESAMNADPSWVDLVAEAGHIRSKTLNLEFTRDDLASRGYSTWIALARFGWKFERSALGLLAQKGTLKLNLTTDEECEMIREIHLARCYDLRLPGEWEAVDIGANVGMAALFFSQQPGCRRVTSFEPFAPTAAAFEENVKLNPELAPKITLVRQALGESESVLTVDYNPQLRGSMSLTGVGDWRGTSTTGSQQISIKVETASVALAPVFAGLGPRRLLGKIDCEGSEYGIFRDLDRRGTLANFSAFVIEWHGRGPDEIVEILLRHGFVVQIVPLSEDHLKLGLIYATRLPFASPNTA